MTNFLILRLLVLIPFISDFSRESNFNLKMSSMNNLVSKKLKEELERLENFSEIIGTAIVDRNGLLISSRLPRDIDERK